MLLRCMLANTAGLQSLPMKCDPANHGLSAHRHTSTQIHTCSTCNRMAGGVSRHYESSWIYNPGGNRFEDRVGAILARGANLQETFKQQALATAQKAVAFENEQQHGIKAVNVPGLNSTQKEHVPVDGRGFVWVTEQGDVVGPCSEQTFTEMPPPPTPKSMLTTERQKHMASLDATQRSMYLWKKVNPGCMEVNTTLPKSSYTTHYAYKPELMEPVNKERHRMKTDFTAYADQQLKSAPRK